ncbi:UNVERIFIED_CONTAM: hypothetical protein Sradi_0489100 [Sesamum radiatum]|uniref:Aminotransferase-like plant mobile domain-containing protein n=1 Tax=Sesamum radiatum TaxID=300843 RepID=A0AAW2W894_SESRA
MVYFKDKSSPSGEHHLIILDNQHQPIEKGTILVVYAPLIGGRNRADDDRCSNVSINKWVKFWSKKAIKYHLPPPHKEKKTVRPKSTHNPLGDITTHKRWSIAEEALFEKLCSEGNLKEEIYLAAYLSCWLCTFVLPGKDVNSIRPSTFKMASMMANGRQVSLAIPVLGSIYEDLNTTATSSKLARTTPSFPVHFVYAWLAFYFKTHYPVWQGLRGPKLITFPGEGGAKYYDPQEARKRIHKAEFVSWACNMIVKNRLLWTHDCTGNPQI